MNRIHKFLRLSSTDQCLLVKSAVLLVAIRLGLWLLPFKALRRLLSIVTKPTIELKEAGQVTTDRVVWAVVVTSRYLPAVNSCLTQALTVQVLLVRRGQPAHLRIGVAKNDKRQLQAHAWVELEGRSILGGTECLSRYIPLPPLKGERS